MRQRVLDINFYKLLKQRNASLLLAVGMCLTNIVLGLSIFLTNERVVLVPPQISKSFWCDKNSVSKEYLEEMSVFFANQLLDVSPESASFQRGIILRYVVPEFHNKLEKRLVNEERRYRKQGISTSFKPIKIKVNSKFLSVELVGDLLSFVGQERVKQSRETYRLNYRYRDGRLLITNFELLEAKNGN